MRLFLCLVLALAPTVAFSAERFPIHQVNDSQEAGIFRNRQPRFRRSQPAPQAAPAPEARRTSPVDPNAAPKFEAAPSQDQELSTEAELTPEQKQALFHAIVAFASALIGAFAGSGGLLPILTAILGALKGIQLPAKAPKPEEKK